MNFSLKPSTSKSAKHASEDFKRALAAAVTISISSITDTNTPQEAKNAGNAAEKKQWQQNKCELRKKFLAVAEKSVTVSQQRSTSCSSFSSFASFSSASSVSLSSKIDNRPKSYRHKKCRSSSTTSNDDRKRTGTLSKSEALKAIGESDRSRKPKENVVENKLRSLLATKLRLRHESNARCTRMELMAPGQCRECDESRNREQRRKCRKSEADENDLSILEGRQLTEHSGRESYFSRTDPYGSIRGYQSTKLVQYQSHKSMQPERHHSSDSNRYANRNDTSDCRVVPGVNHRRNAMPSSENITSQAKNISLSSCEMNQPKFADIDALDALDAISDSSAAECRAGCDNDNDIQNGTPTKRACDKITRVVVDASTDVVNMELGTPPESEQCGLTNDGNLTDDALSDISDGFESFIQQEVSIIIFDKNP